MAQDTTNIPKLIEAAVAALQRGDARAALAMLRDAESREPANTQLKLNIALALRLGGDFGGAIQALDAALAIDPYLFIALLSKGAILERLGQLRGAAAIYRNALKIAPRPEHTPAAMQAPIQRAREVVAADSESLAAFLREQLRGLRERHADAPLARIDQSLEVLAGTRRVYVAEPLQLHVPALPAIQFYERSMFPWLAELEAATDAIRHELLALVAAGLEGFAPYIEYPPGAPVNQWEELNHSPLWQTLHLWRDGSPQREVLAKCPQTAAVLQRLPLADQPGMAPTAVFSALAPHTHIPPHTGSTNARLLVHLPLVLPGPARFRVGNELRPWRMGEAWVFDDSIEHEAWNDADQTRFILIFDIWNPFLSAAEKELLTAMMTARNAWYQNADRAP